MRSDSSFPFLRASLRSCAYLDHTQSNGRAINWKALKSRVSGIIGEVSGIHLERLPHRNSQLGQPASQPRFEANISRSPEYEYREFVLNQPFLFVIHCHSYICLLLYGCLLCVLT
jgi:hypothetical protein